MRNSNLVKIYFKKSSIICRSSKLNGFGILPSISNSMIFFSTSEAGKADKNRMSMFLSSNSVKNLESVIFYNYLCKKNGIVKKNKI